MRKMMPLAAFVVIVVLSAGAQVLAEEAQGLTFDPSFRLGLGVPVGIDSGATSRALDFGIGFFSLDDGRVRTLGLTLVLACDHGWDSECSAAEGLGVLLADIRLVHLLYFGATYTYFFTSPTQPIATRHALYFSFSLNLGTD